jgi:predicted PurR-regulated permease PerM
MLQQWGKGACEQLMSSKDIFRATVIVLGTLAGAFILLTSINIVVVLLVAIIIASAVRPIVVQLMQWHISEGLAIVLVYLTIVLGIFTLIALVIPPIVSAFVANLQNEDALANRLIYGQIWISSTLQPVTGSSFQLVDPETIRHVVGDAVQAIQDGIPNMVSGASATLGDMVLTFVIGVYWLTSHTKAIDFTTHLFTLQNRERVRRIIYEIETMMGSYVRGIVFVALSVGLANFLILLLLHIPNAGTLGSVIGVSTLLPMVGGFLGGGLASFLALINGTPLHALAVLGAFMAVQQVETHYLTPRTVSQSIGLDPVLTIVCVLIGFTLYGVVGAIVAAPLMGTAAVLLRELVIEPRKADVDGYIIEDGLIVINPDAEGKPVHSEGAPIGSG